MDFSDEEDEEAEAAEPRPKHAPLSKSEVSSRSCGDLDAVLNAVPDAVDAAVSQAEFKVEVHGALSGSVLHKATYACGGAVLMGSVRQALRDAGVAGAEFSQLLLDGQECGDEQRLPQFEGGQTAVVQLVARAAVPSGSVEVHVRASLTGALLHTAVLKRGLVEELRASLVTAGIDRGDRDFKLICGSVTMQDDDILQQPKGGGAVAVDLIWGEERQRQPQPRPASRSSSGRHPPGFCGDGWVSGISNCFTGDSVALVVALDADGAANSADADLGVADASLAAGSGLSEVPCLFEDLKVGDLVATGSEAPGKRHRRVARIWRSPVQGGKAAVVRLSEGCRLTGNHPAWSPHLRRWMPSKAYGAPVLSPEDFVYGVELEGHVDTILVGGVLCAALGVYCGPDFGWNIFTRKTVRCDTPCEKCAVAYHPDIDFSSIQPSDMLERYQPY